MEYDNFQIMAFKPFLNFQIITFSNFQINLNLQIIKLIGAIRFPWQ